MQCNGLRPFAIAEYTFGRTFAQRCHAILLHSHIKRTTPNLHILNAKLFANKNGTSLTFGARRCRRLQRVTLYGMSGWFGAWHSIAHVSGCDCASAAAETWRRSLCTRNRQQHSCYCCRQSGKLTTKVGYGDEIRKPT